VVNNQYEKDGKMKYSSHYTVDNIRISYYNIRLLLEKNNCNDLIQVYMINTEVYIVPTLLTIVMLIENYRRSYPKETLILVNIKSV
jgi:hypothetical protein